MRRLLFALLFATSAFAATKPDLSGRVVDESGKPVANAWVAIYSGGPREGVSPFCPTCYADCRKHTRAAKSGAYHIDDLDPSLLFRVLVFADGYEPVLTPKIDPKQPLEVKLKKRDPADAAREARGRVLDAAGKPVVGAIVTPQAVHDDRITAFGEWADTMSATNERGEFGLRLDKPTMKLDAKIEARGFAPKIERLLVPGEAPRDIKLARGATVTGVVMRDGKPLRDSIVAVSQVDRRSQNFLGPQEVATDRNGRFVIPSLAADTYVVFGTMSSFAPAAVVAKKIDVAGEDATIDAGTLTANEGHRIAGRLVVPDGFTIPPKTRVTLGRMEAFDAQMADVRDDGTFEFRGVPNERVSVSAMVRGLVMGAETTNYDARYRRPIFIADRDIEGFEIRMVPDPRRGGGEGSPGAAPTPAHR